MADCRRTVEQLTPYLDGLLPPSEQAEVERHLEHCSPCRQVATDAHGGRTVLRQRVEPLRHESLPPGLRARCESLARQHAPAPVSWGSRLVPLLAVTALVLATGLAVFSMATRRSDVLLAQQLTLDHMKCFHLLTSSRSAVDAKAVEAFLAERHGWDVHVPPSSSSVGVSLLGARRCLYASGTIPHLMYRAHGEDISLFVLAGERRPRADLTALGYASRIWSRGATTYVLVSPRSGGALTPAVRYVMQQVR